MNKKVIIGIITGLVVIIGAIVLWNVNSDNASVRAQDFDPTRAITVGDDPNQNQAPAGYADHTFGNPDSSVTFVEYADLACTGCAGMASTIDRLREDYSDRVLFVWRHWPNPNITGHQNTRAASVAAESAANQGKFWEYTSLLFANQSSWAYLSASTRFDEFLSYADALSLDLERFEHDFKNPAAANRRIDFNYQLGKLQQITGTPSFFINGIAIKGDSGEYSLPGDEKLRRLLDEALAEAN
jgi:protein-disulfide isomerase